MPERENWYEISLQTRLNSEMFIYSDDYAIA